MSKFCDLKLIPTHMVLHGYYMVILLQLCAEHELIIGDFRSRGEYSHKICA